MRLLSHKHDHDVCCGALPHHTTDFIHRWPLAFGLTSNGGAGALMAGPPRPLLCGITPKTNGGTSSKWPVGSPPVIRAAIATLAEGPLTLDRLAWRTCVYRLGPRSPSPCTARFTGLTHQGRRLKQSMHAGVIRHEQASHPLPVTLSVFVNGNVAEKSKYAFQMGGYLFFSTAPHCLTRPAVSFSYC